MIVVGMCLMILASSPSDKPSPWIASGQAGYWGTVKGLKLGIHPKDLAGSPRGLLQIYYPTLKKGADDLINYIAIEPIVGGKRGYSEMEHSALDKAQGKRLWVLPSEVKIVKLSNGVEVLKIPIQVERFENGTHVRLDAEIHSDRPDELQLSIHAEPDSAPIEYCVLTATMGNKSRSRILYLKERPVYSLDLWPDFTDTGFAWSHRYGVDRILRKKDGSYWAAITTNEDAPQKVKEVPGAEGWGYFGDKVTQYWRTLAPTAHEKLEVWVNGRYTYWGNLRPIPGGIAFENFEFYEPFVDGQTFILGMTRLTPKQLGFAYKTP